MNEILGPETLKALILIVSGAIIGLVGNVIISISNRKSEERKHFNQLVIDASIRGWEGILSHKKKGIAAPLEVHIIEMSMILEEIGKKKVSKESIIPILENAYTIGDTALEWLVKRDRE